MSLWSLTDQQSVLSGVTVRNNGSFTHKMAAKTSCMTKLRQPMYKHNCSMIIFPFIPVPCLDRIYLILFYSDHNITGMWWVRRRSKGEWIAGARTVTVTGKSAKFLPVYKRMLSLILRNFQRDFRSNTLFCRFRSIIFYCTVNWILRNL